VLSATKLVRPQLEFASSVWHNTVKHNTTKVEAVHRSAARFTCHDYRRNSHVTETAVGLSKSVELVVEYWCCTVSAMDWLPFLPQSISSQCGPNQRVWNQLQTDPVQSDYGKPCRLMSNQLCLTSLSSTEHHPADVTADRPCFNCTTALFLSAAVRLLVVHQYYSYYYFHSTHLYLHRGATLLDHRVGTFVARRQINIYIFRPYYLV